VRRRTGILAPTPKHSHNLEHVCSYDEDVAPACALALVSICKAHHNVP
jgi:hypothetical protein